MRNYTKSHANGKEFSFSKHKMTSSRSLLWTMILATIWATTQNVNHEHLKGPHQTKPTTTLNAATSLKLELWLQF